MRIIDQVLDRFGRRETPQLLPVQLPPRLTVGDHRELREAQVRIPRKWRAFDAMLADYDGTDHVLRFRRR
jgi:hypothetical protein